MKLPGKRRRGRPKRRFMDAVRGYDGRRCDGGRRRGEQNGDGESAVATANGSSRKKKIKYKDAVRRYDGSGCDGGRRRGESRSETRPLTGAAAVDFIMEY